VAPSASPPSPVSPLGRGGDGGRSIYFREATLLRLSNVVKHPDEVRWATLDVSAGTVALTQGASVLIALGVQAAVFACYVASDGSVTRRALLLTVANRALPPLLKLCTARFELHRSQSSHDISVMLKLVVLRVTSAIVLPWLVCAYAATPDELVVQAHSNLVSSELLGPFIGLATTLLVARAKRALAAPLQAASQEELHAFYEGDAWSLAERFVTVRRSGLGAVCAVVARCARWPCNVRGGPAVCAVSHSAARAVGV